MSRENSAYNGNLQKNGLSDCPGPSTHFSDSVLFNSFGNLPETEKFRQKRINSQDFPAQVKPEIKQEQEYKCAVLEIQPQPGEILQIHHKRPKCHGRKGTKDNAVGVLPEVHKFLDLMALNKKVYFDEIMEAGKEYVVGYLNAVSTIQKSITNIESPSSHFNEQYHIYDIAAGGD